MIREQLRESIVIDALGSGGWGLARLSNGRKVRLPGVSVGERHLVDAFRTFKGWRARSIICEEPMPSRVQSDCTFHGQCGGCTHRHLSPKDRVATLKDDLSARLRRFGHDSTEVSLLSDVPNQGYRNRAVLQPTKTVNGQWQLSFSRTPSFEGVALKDCLIQSPGIRKLCLVVQQVLGDEHEAYIPDQTVGSIRHIILATSDMPDEHDCRVTFAFHGPADAAKIAVVKDRLARLIPRVEFYVDELPKRNAGLMSKPVLIFQSSSFQPRIQAQSFQVSPRSWWTQTPMSFKGLLTTIKRFSQLVEGDRVLEIGCGVGTVPIMLNRLDIDWLGIDHERCAVDDAQHNAKHLGARYTFRVGDGEHWLRKLAGRTPYSVLILHAMRMPFGTSFMKLAGAMKPRRLIYIAPNPTALLKDISVLEGYQLDETLLLDHTPGSGHYLTVAVLSQSLKAIGNRA